MRICDVCQEEMIQGYCVEGGLEYYCSEECLHTKYTDEEWAEMYEEGGDTYWTQWDDEIDWDEE